MTKLTPQAQWEQCLSILKVNIDRQTYDALLANIAFVSLNKEENYIYLRVQSSFIYETIEHTKRIRQLLYSVIWSVYKTKLIIRYQILADSTTNTTTNVEGTAGTTVETKINRRTKKVEEVQESELESRLNENYTFDNFIEGNGNKLLRSVGKSIADNPKQTTFNPLFIYGGSGVGKTHLVNAIGIQFKRNFPQKRVLYVTAHDFKVQFMTAKQQNRINDFIYFYQTIDVLIIDDVQEFSGLTGTQQTFFHIFNHL
ncbi:MAG: DnaA/Hda family protein, partial [Bacteroidaceae bacterium]|nr:DnaA/Hda family protein [Bacteroidaceae bacterium]